MIETLSAMNPLSWALVLATAAFLIWIKWTSYRRSQLALSTLRDHRSFEPGAEPDLVKALFYVSEEMEDAKGTKKETLETLLKNRRVDVIRKMDKALDRIRSHHHHGDEDLPPEMIVGSNLISNAMRAYESDVVFRQHWINFLRNESAVSVWEELLIQMTLRGAELDDAAAFRSVLDAYIALPDEGTVWKSPTVALMLVEWAFDVESVQHIQGLRPRFAAHQKTSDDPEQWSEVLENFETAQAE